MEGFSTHFFVGFFLVFKKSFKTSELGLHIRVDLEVARDDLLHLAHVVVHVLIYDRGCLHARDNLAFLGKQLSCFLEVFEVVFLELFVFVEDVVHFFMEGQQIIVDHLHALASIKSLLQVIKLGFTLLRGLVNLPRWFCLKIFSCDVRVWSRFILFRFVLQKLMRSCVCR